MRARLIAGVLLCLTLACVAVARPAAAANPTSESIWVPDYYGGKVLLQQLNYTTTPVTYTRKSISVASRHCQPNSVAVHDGLLYIVCNSSNGGDDKVLVYDATALTYKKTIGGLGVDRVNYFSGAGLIAILFDVHGSLWVSGYLTNDLLRVPAHRLADASPKIDRQVIDSPDSSAGMTLDTDHSFWIVGQYDNGIVVNFPDSVLNASGSFLGATALNPNPRYCASNDVSGCTPIGKFNSPEGVAVLDGAIFVSNNGGDAPGASLVRLTKETGGTLAAQLIGGTAGKPFSCPGGLFTLTRPGSTPFLWVNDEDYAVANTDCGAHSADQGNTIGRVLEFTPDGLNHYVTQPRPVKFTDWGQIRTSSPGFGGIFVQEN